MARTPSILVPLVALALAGCSSPSTPPQEAWGNDAPYATPSPPAEPAPEESTEETPPTDAQPTPTTTTTTTTATPAAPAPAPTRTEARFDLQVSMTALPGAGTNGNTRNCVEMRPGEGSRVLGGDATMNWSASPGAERLSLTYAPPAGEPLVVSGASPLTLALPADALPGAGGSARLFVEIPPGQPAVALQQPVTLLLVLEHEGEAPAFSVKGCRGG